MQTGKIASWRKAQADRNRRLRKWPLGTAVFVKTAHGYEKGRIVHHHILYASPHRAIVEFPVEVDLGDGNVPSKRHNLPYRSMKPIRRVVLAEKLFKRLAYLTEINHHGEGYLTAARALGLKQLVAQFERINREALALGHLPAALRDERRVAYAQLFDDGILRLSREQYKRLYDCF